MKIKTGIQLAKLATTLGWIEKRIGKLQKFFLMDIVKL